MKEYVVYANERGLEPELYGVFNTREEAEEDVKSAKADGLNAFIVEEN